MIRNIFKLLLILCVAAGTEGYAQLAISGQTDVVVRNASANDYTNKTFAQLSKFDFFRTRVFFDAAVSENAAAFVQVLFDNRDLRIYGGYLKLEELGGSPVNLNIGLIPNTVGTFGPRTYSNRNPLVGTPLVYLYHTSLSLRNFQTSTDDLWGFRGQGHSSFGLPLIYDACWNTGIELFGSAGMVDWSIGALTGAVSAPATDPAKDIPQLTSKLVFYFHPGLFAGLNVFAGPYIPEALGTDNGVEPFKVEEFLNLGGGLSLFFAAGHIEFNGEAFFARWEHPFLPNLEAVSGYADIEYTVAPQWFLAGRAETMRFSEIDFGPAHGQAHWDYPVDRVELGIGYKIDRAVSMKLVTQITRATGTATLDDEIVALQVATTY